MFVCLFQSEWFNFCFNYIFKFYLSLNIRLNCLPQLNDMHAKQEYHVFLPGSRVGNGDVRTIMEEEDMENTKDEKAVNDQDGIKVAL